jgi:hypothetical protein
MPLVASQKRMVWSYPAVASTTADMGLQQPRRQPTAGVLTPEKLLRQGQTNIQGGAAGTTHPAEGAADKIHVSQCRRRQRCAKPGTIQVWLAIALGSDLQLSQTTTSRNKCVGCDAFKTRGS